MNNNNFFCISGACGVPAAGGGHLPAARGPAGRARRHQVRQGRPAPEDHQDGPRDRQGRVPDCQTQKEAGTEKNELFL